MRIIPVLITVFCCIIAFGCNELSGSSASNPIGQSAAEEDEVKDPDGYKDGTYCATVEYYYSETGTLSTYTLHVDIENNDLVKIYWPNGGWLDETHFIAPDISDGHAMFTSDREVDYTVTILGEEGDCVVSYDADDEDALIDEQEERERRKEEIRQRQEEREMELQQEENENNVEYE